MDKLTDALKSAALAASEYYKPTRTDVASNKTVETPVLVRKSQRVRNIDSLVTPASVNLLVDKLESVKKGK